MTDKNDAIRQVEEMLGSDGGQELAAAVFETLCEYDYVTFDAQHGFAFCIPDWNDDGAKWNEILTESFVRLHCHDLTPTELQSFNLK